MKFEDFFEQCKIKLIGGIANDDFNQALMEVIIDAQMTEITDHVSDKMTPFEMLKSFAEGLNSALEGLLNASIEAKKIDKTNTQFTFVLDPVIRGKVRRHELFSVTQDSTKKFLVIYKDKKYKTQKSFDKLLHKISDEEEVKAIIDSLLEQAD